ncbi:MAG: hypothetical protein ACK4JE_02795 [Endomicrobiia bacterium]
MSNYILFFFIALLSGCATTKSTQKTSLTSQKPQVEIVEAEGLAPLTDDLIKSREIAISDAQKRAVELVVGVYVSAENFVSKAKLIEDNITGETEGYIEKYDILKEWKEEPFYKVKIKARVRKEDLSKKIEELNLAPKKQTTATVSFWIKEKIDDKPSESSIVEKEIMKIFTEAGFTVSDRKPQEYYKDIQGILDENPDELESKLKSDLVILGDASSNFNTDQGLGGFISYRAIASIKVIKNLNKDIITTVQETAGGVDLNKDLAAKASLINVGKKSGKELTEKIIRYFEEHPYNNIILKGETSINEINILVRRIRAFPSVKDCWLKSFSGDEALLEFIIKRGNISDVAKQIEQVEIPYKILSIENYTISMEKK